MSETTPEYPVRRHLNQEEITTSVEYPSHYLMDGRGNPCKTAPTHGALSHVGALGCGRPPGRTDGSATTINLPSHTTARPPTTPVGAGLKPALGRGTGRPIEYGPA